jgi:2-keto-3-deoxy-galactonokinase
MSLENANRRESLQDVTACQQLAAESGLTAGQVEHLLAVQTQQLAERRSTEEIEASLRGLLFGGLE